MHNHLQAGGPGRSPGGHPSAGAALVQTLRCQIQAELLPSPSPVRRHDPSPLFVLLAVDFTDLRGLALCQVWSVWAMASSSEGTGREEGQALPRAVHT